MRSVARDLMAAVLVLGVCGGLAQRATAAPADNPTAQKLVDDFAPFLSAMILQRINVAQRMFVLERPAQSDIESSAATEVYSRFSHIDGTPVTLIGMRVLGDHIGTALFTTVTEHGPVAFKVSYYRFGTDMHVGRVEMADRWTEIENLVLTVDPLPTPVTGMLMGNPQ